MMEVMDGDVLSLPLIHDFMLCHEMELRLAVANVSSGTGTSSTVSSPSSLS